MCVNECMYNTDTIAIAVSLNRECVFFRHHDFFEISRRRGVAQEPAFCEMTLSFPLPHTTPRSQ